MRLVLDTNVVLDLLLFADPSVRPIAAACSAGRARCLADAATLDEWQRVVSYRDFGLAPAQARALVARYREHMAAPMPLIGVSAGGDHEKNCGKTATLK